MGGVSRAVCVWLEGWRRRPGVVSGTVSSTVAVPKSHEHSTEHSTTAVPRKNRSDAKSWRGIEPQPGVACAGNSQVAQARETAGEAEEVEGLGVEKGGV